MIILSSGEKACLRCLKRPVIQRRYPSGRVVPGSYCRRCHTEATRESRERGYTRLLSPEEWDAIQALRSAPAAARHHRTGR